MSRGPGPIPARWLHCPRKSETLIADRFLAFKTPLKNEFQSQMPANCYFTPLMLFDVMKRHKQRIGLWIDLTNTDRFYDKNQIMDAGCKYVKLKCRGHGETPSIQQVESFIELVEEFTQEFPLDVIGVHCTHGFNRTGFLIVSYMVIRLDCALDAALMEFARARPPGIYKGDYIKELYDRYGEDSEVPLPPQLPSWYLEYDDGDRSNYQEEDDGDYPEANSNKRGTKRKNDFENGQEGPSHKRKRPLYNANAVFMEGVPKESVKLVKDEPLIMKLQDQVRTMCGSKLQGFAGAQPVSMDKRNIRYLTEMPYRVSWKADGTRYMMLILREGELYFFDRDNSVFAVEGLRFPSLADPRRHITNTLVDGEMVIDIIGQQRIPRYLVYDIIYLNGREVRKQPFCQQRINLIRTELIEARRRATEQGKLDRSKEPFGVRLKDFWDITKAQSLLGPKFKEQLSHEPDGLIFQPSLDPYESGVCPRVLKWKPHHMNSIDFRLMIKEENGYGMVKGKKGLLYVGGMEQSYGEIKLTRELKQLNNKIIECKFENGKWVLMRERTDKSFPNSFETAKNVYESIRCPVTEEGLLTLIQKHGYRSDSELMPPPPSH
ncbi:mRNA-capping enzyme [Anopheles funestus]|uniref:mRNA-capping enzyme n=1 Tax=Anopheles funestus TaxID=62324 RepID=UPI0020C6A263|nr:mRNA-capping enzyme [Anopheles funestus]XP_049293059.1 mRNA-capping enzyme [Anopheles funestus]XP_049293060.1 mRNA-capping enzyme [Anopheles funestus]